MVRLGRTGSFTNNKSGSESENMDRDPNFSGSSGGGRRPTRHSGRRIIDGDDSSIRRSGRQARRMIVYDESSSSSSGSEDEYVEKAVAESNGNPDAVERAEGDVNADGAVATRRPTRAAAKHSWLVKSAKLDRPMRKLSRRPVRSSRTHSAVSYCEDGDDMEEEENKPNSNGVSPPQDDTQEGQPPNENGMGRRRHVKVIEYSEAEPETDQGDMYSRLKERSSRRPARVDYGEQKRNSRGLCEDNRESIRHRLRERKINISHDRQAFVDDLLRRNRRSRKKRRKRSNSSSSSSDSSDCARGHSRSRQGGHDKAEKAGSKTGFLDLQPNEVDPNITFASVGGLHHIIEKLRETVILPLVYKEFYADRNITPPKGILFHGPPGTGKTMLARALVNECSTLGGQKVTFFVRKGGDLLSKWVGESEKQLRRLFEEAYRCQPSIIFFDEIDGLAPVRSSKTDQVHNSVVSTLLAELDGVKDRGDVIIIGATNRIDSIDPALRRPGRFDHEFGFFLPALKDRIEIIKSHTSKWKGDNVSEGALEELAKSTAGYSGADLKLLCAEASVSALRRRYPQIYSSTSKYLLDYDSIKVESSDWFHAMEKIKPSSSRMVNSIITTGQPLPPAVVPLLQDVVDDVEKTITTFFPLKDKQHLMNEPGPKRYLIFAKHSDNGVDQYIVPALLHCFESVPVFVLNLESSFCKDSGSETSAIMRVFNEADRIKKLAIILIPAINLLVQGMTPQGQEFLHQQIMKASAKPVFVLATAQPSTQHLECDEVDIPSSVMLLFKGVSRLIEPASEFARKHFFAPLFSERSVMVRVEKESKFNPLEELPLAPPPPPRKPSDEELKATERREANVHRRLRKFLREVIGKLVRNKKYREFVVAVDANEVKDYYTIIKNPMCLEQMMCKLNNGCYLSARDFLNDINLIRDNAVEYNPLTTEDGKAIRHAAYELVDNAALILEDEMNSDFEDMCLTIIEDRKKRNESVGTVTEVNGVSGSIKTESAPKAGCSKEVTGVNTVTNGHTENATSFFGGGGNKRKVKWGGGNNAAAKKGKITTPAPTPSPDVSNTSDGGNSSKGLVTCPGLAPPTVSSLPETRLNDCTFVKAPKHEEYTKRLHHFLAAAVKVTDKVGVNGMLDLRYQLLLAVEKFYALEDKTPLLDNMKIIIAQFKKLHQNEDDG